MTSKVEYLGNLRTECTHLRSGQRFVTDAPVDNQGKGEAFSPTDLSATPWRPACSPRWASAPATTAST